MPTSTISLLIDTNVWLDRFLPGRSRHVVAGDLIDLCIEEGVTILYPMRALQDVYWQVIVSNKRWVRESKSDLSEGYAKAINGFAWDCLDAMAEIGAPVGADLTDVWLARHLRDLHPDFEDDMVLAAAERAKVDYLITSDRALIHKATVAALTPEDALVMLRARQKMRA